MKNSFKIIFFLFFSCTITAQEKTEESVYFEFDKYSLDKTQTGKILTLLSSPDFSQFDAIQLYGYCDDRGTEEYNNILSDNRVATVQKILISSGILPNKIFICEGKGRVNVDKDTIHDLHQIRYKNRRVDLFFLKKSVHIFFPANPKVGDVILLSGVTFEMGSSALTSKAKAELDRTIISLKKYKSLRFEIKGHVCCTSNKHSDAIDQETQDRNLSINRAKNVFVYLRSKGISPYRMSYKGYGNRFPLGKGDAPDRRVEILITKL
ncbi:MAG: OmpA family protein [Bacteroidota bacterium]